MRIAQVAATIGVLGSWVSSVHAQEKPATPPAAPEIKKTVDAFLGRWTLQSSMTPPGAQPIKFVETIDCKKAALGRGVYCRDTYKVPGMGAMEYNYLIAYDTDSKLVHMLALGSSGEVHDHKCSWKSETEISCQPLKGMIDGKPMTEDVAFTVEGKTLKVAGGVTTAEGNIKFEGTGKRAGKSE
jgi:hypothetical protein